MLLDTNALLWLGLGRGLSASARDVLDGALLHSVVYVSAVSAWEIGNLVKTRGLHLAPDAATWFADVTSTARLVLVSLDAATALASTTLPGSFHRDPADRFLVATARALDVPIVTRDARILDYAAAGHVRAVAC